MTSAKSQKPKSFWEPKNQKNFCGIVNPIKRLATKANQSCGLNITIKINQKNKMTNKLESLEMKTCPVYETCGQKKENSQRTRETLCEDLYEHCSKYNSLKALENAGKL